MFLNRRRQPNSPTAWSVSFLTLASLLAPLAATVSAQIDRSDRYDNCRLVDANARPELLIVREAASVDSQGVGTLALGERVTLDLNWQPVRGPYGYYWIEIIAPFEGFIANRRVVDNRYSTLRNCSFTPTPGLSGELDERVPRPDSLPPASRFNVQFETYCQEVINPEGLAIRERPSADSPRLDGVARGENVVLVDDTSALRDDTGRFWLAIDFPTEGYILGGYSPRFENISPCP